MYAVGFAGVLNFLVDLRSISPFHSLESPTSLALLNITERIQGDLQGVCHLSIVERLCLTRGDSCAGMRGEQQELVKRLSVLEKRFAAGEGRRTQAAIKSLRTVASIVRHLSSSKRHHCLHFAQQVSTLLRLRWLLQVKAQLVSLRARVATLERVPPPQPNERAGRRHVTCLHAVCTAVLHVPPTCLHAACCLG